MRSQFSLIFAGPRRGLALALCTIAGLACSRGKESSPGAHPGSGAAAGPENVILILVDTLRADHLGAYGYTRPTSPNLDAFARTHARFAQNRSQAGCTYPSVNSLLTSRSAFNFLGQARRHIGIPPGFTTLAERLKGRGLRTVAVSASSIVRRTPSTHNPFGGFERGFDQFDEACWHRRADCIARRARRFLNHNTEPFFLYLHYMDPHAPYSPPPPFDTRFAAAGFDGAPWSRDGSARALFESIEGKGPHIEPAPADVRHLVDLYDGEIAYLDTELGELLRDLEARGLFERSVVILAADHGEEFLEHGHVWHCDNAFETMLRVPLLVHVPGLTGAGGRAPAVIDTPVENLDIAPTVLDALGMPIPPELEGRSLLPVLSGKPLPSRPSFAWQNEFRSATDGRRKLVLDTVAGTRALFDLERDPGETRDIALAERPAFHELNAALMSWLVRIEGAPSGPKSRALAEETRKLLESLGYLK